MSTEQAEVRIKTKPVDQPADRNQSISALTMNSGNANDLEKGEQNDDV